MLNLLPATASCIAILCIIACSGSDAKAEADDVSPQFSNLLRDHGIKEYTSKRGYVFDPSDHQTLRWVGRYEVKECSGETKESAARIPRVDVLAMVPTDGRGRYLVEVYYELYTRFMMVSERFQGLTDDWVYTHRGDGYRFTIRFLEATVAKKLGSPIMFAGRCFKQVDGIGAQFQ